MSCLMLLVAEQASFPRILLSKPTRWVASADSSMCHERKAFGGSFVLQRYQQYIFPFLSNSVCCTRAVYCTRAGFGITSAEDSRLLYIICLCAPVIPSSTAEAWDASLCLWHPNLCFSLRMRRISCVVPTCRRS